MTRLFVVALALLASSAAPAASAQTRQPANQRQPMAQARYEQAYQHGQRFAFEAFLDRNGDRMPNAPLEQIDVANRVSGLIEQGRCDEARALANAEGTRNMAVRVRQICRPARSQAN